MPSPQRYKDWKFISRVTYDDTKDGTDVDEYSIHFYRERTNGEWYDEIRYDSHETRRGREIISPHFHMKLLSGFKPDPNAAVEEIKHVIDTYVKHISGVVER